MWSPSGPGGPLKNTSVEVALRAARTSDSTHADFKLATDVDGKITLPAPAICASLVAYTRLRITEQPSGKPVRGIYVYGYAGTNAPRDASVPRPDQTIPAVGIIPETDAQGVVSFELDVQSLPKYVGLGTVDVWNCSAHTFPLDEILQTGVVAAYDAKRCGKLEAKTVTPVPGEVVVYDRLFSKWDWFLQELP